MPENPYKSPEAEGRLQRPKLLRTVLTGTLCGTAAGVAYTIFALYQAIYALTVYEDGLEEQFVYLPRLLLTLLLINALPLTVVGGMIGLMIGVVQKKFVAELAPRS